MIERGPMPDHHSMVEDLTPPEPRDEAATRPPLDLPHVQNQVRGIQTFLAQERRRREQLK